MAKRGGQPNNDNPSKNKPWAEAIRKAIIQDPAKLHKIAQALITKAGKGDVSALREIGDRLDGKPHQTVSAEVDTNVTVEVIRFAGQAPGK